MGQKKDAKIKHRTLWHDYANGGLKSADIFFFVSLKRSVRRLFDNNFHQCKVTPHYLTQKYLRKNFNSIQI